MLDHIGLQVFDYERSKLFYQRVLAPLGGALAMEVTAEQTGHRAHAGFGMNGKPCFWISTDPALGRGQVHVAFTAADRRSVDAFHAAALAAGARDNGAPGPRLHYHPNYYGAFVLDPDGHNIEAVCRIPTVQA